jgi:chemotaxis protein histidine kinase CheA
MSMTPLHNTKTAAAAAPPLLIVKVTFKSDVRRISLPMPVSFDALLVQLRSLYNVSASTLLDVKYQDDEGDLITLGSSLELAEAIRLSPSTLRLQLTSFEPAVADVVLAVMPAPQLALASPVESTAVESAQPQAGLNVDNQVDLKVRVDKAARRALKLEYLAQRRQSAVEEKAQKKQEQAQLKLQKLEKVLEKKRSVAEKLVVVEKNAAQTKAALEREEQRLTKIKERQEFVAKKLAAKKKAAAAAADAPKLEQRDRALANAVEAQQKREAKLVRRLTMQAARQQALETRQRMLEQVSQRLAPEPALLPGPETTC